MLLFNKFKKLGNVFGKMRYEFVHNFQYIFVSELNHTICLIIDF